MPYYLSRGTRRERETRKYQTAGSCKRAAEDFLVHWQMGWARRYSSEAFKAIDGVLKDFESKDPSLGTETNPVGVEVPLADSGIVLCVSMWRSDG